MKKVLKVCVCGLMAAMLVAGCAKKESESTEASNVKLAEYKGVTYTPASTEVTDEDVEMNIQNFLQAMGTDAEVDRAAADGDTVNIDYVGLKDGVAFEGGTASASDLVLGSGSFIEGFEEGLVGSVKGQELSLNVTFPADYPSEDLAGQAVVFDVTVNAVKEFVPAVLNDELVAGNTDYKTVDELRTGLKADLIANAELNALNQKKNDVFMKVINESEITVVDADVDTYYNEQLAVYEEQAKLAGTDMATMVSMYGMTEDIFKEQLKVMAKEAVRQKQVTDAIAAKENITVTEEDKVQLAVDMGYESKEVMIEQAGEKVVNDYILTEKVVTFIADNAVEA